MQDTCESFKVYRRSLGRTGIEVSEIGYGTWGLGGDAYGAVSDEESTKALLLAFERGVNFFDTSDLYGNGHSESILGKVFRNVREQVVIATKGGMLPHTGFEMPQDFSVRHLSQSLEGSLNRLGTDYVDLYQLHSPSLENIVDMDGIVHTLESFYAAGKIRCYGISVRSPDEGIMAIERYRFPVVQVNFNMIDQRARENGLIALAQRTGTGIIIRTPLVFGFLTGKLNGDAEFSGRDHRANWPVSQRKCWANATGNFSFLWRDKPFNPAQYALRYCLDHVGVSTVIPGMLNCSEVENNTAASAMLPLMGTEMQHIAEIYQKNDFYDPHAKMKGHP